MHQFFLTLFALLLSLCHHSGIAQHTVEAAEVDSVATPHSVLVLPDRYQLARSSTTEASYAVTACVSCRRMDGSSSDR